MKIALIAVGVVVIAAIAFSVWSRIASRRWRKWFDSLSPEEQRKEQERMYKAQQMGS